MKLTEKQKRFCDYYIETGNGAESARRAGYKGNNHDRIANENLRKLEIKAYIDKKLTKKDNKRIASQDEVLELYTKIARGEEKDVSISYDNKGNVIENKIYPTLKERIKALDALAKRYGLDKQKEDNSKEGIDISWEE